MILQQSTKIYEEDGDSTSIKKILRRTFNRITGRRDKSVQEICHLLNSNSYVFCSHQFCTVNIYSQQRKIRIDEKSKDDDAVMKENMVDLYVNRLVSKKWANQQQYIDNIHLMEDMNLNQFATEFQERKGKIGMRSKGNKDWIVIFSPDLKNINPNCNEFWKYCLSSLCKYIPFTSKHQIQIWRVSVDTIDDEQKKSIIEMFNATFRNVGLGTYMIDNPVSRAVQNAIEAGLTMSSVGSTFSCKSQDKLLRNMDKNVEDYESDSDDEDIDWDSGHDFNTGNTSYVESEKTIDHINSIEGKNKTMSSGNNRRVVKISDLGGTDKGSQQQRLVVEMFLKMCGLWKDERGNYEEAMISNGNNGNVLLCPGPAGTGKSFVIDCIVHEVEERAKEKYGLKDGEYKVLVLGPTGKSALSVGGHTIQSSNGLMVPIRDLGKVEKNSLKEGKWLMQLQQNLRNIEAIIFDEYSMMSSVQLFWVVRRWKEGKKKSKFVTITNIEDCPFGGVPVIILGDPAQLPPVGGTSIWLDKTSSNRKLGVVAMAGHEIYRKISQRVMYLTEVRRQSGEFKNILGRLRNGKNTYDDWRLLNEVCSMEQYANVKREEADIINECTIILSTNDAVRRKNIEMLKRLRTNGGRILRINAIHDTDATNNYSTEYCRRLQPKLFVAVGAVVMLQWNICVNAGLVNGSIGIIRDFIFIEKKESPDYIVIEFEDYKGEVFFTGVGRSRWVPIKRERYEFYDQQNLQRYRIQYPIQCCWALTAWKSQGMTIEKKVLVEISARERTCGLTYVQLSRCTDINNLRITRSISLDRLTTHIQKSKSLQLGLNEEIRLQGLWKKTLMSMNLDQSSVVF